MSVTTVAISQPAFLPWAGWFDLVDQADVFVVLDDVGFSKQSWQQRNRIVTAQGLSYITVPVRSSGRLGQRIAHVELAGDVFVEKAIRTVSVNYGRAAHFAHYFPEFCNVFREAASCGRLVDLNCGLIGWLARELGVGTPRLRSTELGVDGKRGAYVAKLCEHLGASCYLSPAGAERYLLEDRGEFERRGISVALQDYRHPVYTQCFEPFAPYASALDLLMNEGESAGDILRSGRRTPRALGEPTSHLEEGK